MLIDTHTHVIATDTKKYPLAPLFGRQSAWSAEHPLDYPDMIKAIDAAGVDKAILVQASSAYAFDNTYVSEAVAAHPNRFTGVFSVDVVAPDAVAKMKHWMARASPACASSPPARPSPSSRLSLRSQHRFPRGNSRPTTACRSACRCSSRARRCWPRVMDRFPKVRVILDHFARVEAADGPPYVGGGAAVRAGEISQSLSQADPPPAGTIHEGQGHAGELLRQGRSRNSAPTASSGARIFPPRRNRCPS